MGIRPVPSSIFSTSPVLEPSEETPEKSVKSSAGGTAGKPGASTTSVKSPARGTSVKTAPRGVSATVTFVHDKGFAFAAERERGYLYTARFGPGPESGRCHQGRDGSWRQGLASHPYPVARTNRSRRAPSHTRLPSAGLPCHEPVSSEATPGPSCVPPRDPSVGNTAYDGTRTARRSSTTSGVPKEPFPAR